MLSRFQYYEEHNSYEPENFTENVTEASKLEYITTKRKILPGLLEYLISFWVFSFFCQEIEQVIFLILIVQFL